MSSDSDPSSGSPHTAPRTSTLLLQFAANHPHERVYLGDLMHLLGDRSFGFLLLLFALPNTLPVIGVTGMSTLTGIPLAIVALQMMLGLPEPKLPAWVTKRSLHRDDFRRWVERVAPWLQKLERLMRPRWLGVSGLTGERLLGAFCLLLAVVLALPIPLGNLGPAIAVAMIALGVIEKDGVLIVIGLLVGLLSLALVSGMVWAMGKAALFFLREVLTR